jgi:arylformamidase
LSNKKYFDLSHTVEHGMITYKGLPAPIICDYLSRADSKNRYEGGAEFQIGKIEMVANTGTYLDSPFHRYAEGMDLADLIIENLADLRSVLIRIPYSTSLEINKSHLVHHRIEAGDAVLFHTGWDIHWGTDAYFENHPFLSRDAAEYLEEKKVKLVGIDSHNIDDTRFKSRPVHTILLGANILIVEHLCNMNLLPDTNFTFTAIPPKIKGVGTFPVRAFGSTT